MIVTSLIPVAVLIIHEYNMFSVAVEVCGQKQDRSTVGGETRDQPKNLSMTIDHLCRELQLNPSQFSASLSSLISTRR